MAGSKDTAPGARSDGREPGAFAFEMVQVGECCVDSGQLMLVDPCYVLSDDGKERGKNGFPSYNEICDRNIGTGVQLKNRYKAPVAVVTGGFGGDGTFPVFAKVDMVTGRVRSVTVVFDDGED